MFLADLKNHAAEYAENFAPHLKGEFQAFVQWLERKKIDETNAGFRPVVPMDQKVPVATAVAADTTRATAIAEATRVDTQANSDLQRETQTRVDEATKQQKDAAQKQSDELAARVEAQHQEALAQEADQLRAITPRSETDTMPVPGNEALLADPVIDEEKERQEKLAADSDVHRVADPHDPAQHVDDGSALSA